MFAKSANLTHIAAFIAIMGAVGCGAPQGGNQAASDRCTRLATDIETFRESRFRAGMEADVSAGGQDIVDGDAAMHWTSTEVERVRTSLEQFVTSFNLERTSLCDDIEHERISQQAYERRTECLARWLMAMNQVHVLGAREEATPEQVQAQLADASEVGRTCGVQTQEVQQRATAGSSNTYVGQMEQHTDHGVNIGTAGSIVIQPPTCTEAQPPPPAPEEDPSLPSAWTPIHGNERHRDGGYRTHLAHCEAGEVAVGLRGTLQPHANHSFIKLSLVCSSVEWEEGRLVRRGAPVERRAPRFGNDSGRQASAECDVGRVVTSVLVSAPDDGGEGWVRGVRVTCGEVRRTPDGYVVQNEAQLPFMGVSDGYLESWRGLLVGLQVGARDVAYWVQGLTVPLRPPTPSP